VFLQTVPTRERLSKHLMKKYIEGEKDEHRLTVEGPRYLRNLDREIDSRNYLSPFRASRCFRKELRRVILAFAARTASVLVSQKARRIVRKNLCESIRHIICKDVLLDAIPYVE
jgi:hypothetical protein